MNWSNYGDVEGQISLFDPCMPFGKMLSEHSQATTEMISELSWKNLSVSKNQNLMFLDARNGASQEQSPETIGALLGELSMHNTLEFHKDGNEYAYYVISMDNQQQTFCLLTPYEWLAIPKESHLSWVLENDAPGKYSLSEKACQGILNRASKRGKELPKILKDALLNMINRTP